MARHSVPAFIILSALLLAGCTAREKVTLPPQPPSPTTTALGTQCPDGVDWCERARAAIPARLRRPLHLPEGPRCPSTRGRTYENRQFGGIVLGEGPVVPLVATARRSEVPRALSGELTFRPAPQRHGWLSIKTLWFSFPLYAGPVWIRARGLDGKGVIRFGETPQLTDPYLPEGATINGAGGFREWPGATWIRSPGCYAWQIDGLTFSRVVAFEARASVRS